MSRKLQSLCVAGAAMLLVSAPAPGANATAPGRLTTPFPTFENLSVYWPVEGDDNNNGVVSVRFREAGAPAWKAGLRLMHVAAGSAEGGRWPNHHAGSVFGLTAGTVYDIELALADPDGGSTTQVVRVSTRKELVAAPDSRVINVTPATFEAAIAKAQPGDVLLLADGAYSTGHGPVIENLHGTAAKPIVIRAANRHRATFPGFMMPACSYILVDGIAVSPWGFNFSWSHDIVVRHCRIVSDFGMYAEGGSPQPDKPGVVSNCYLADNSVTREEATWNADNVSADGGSYGTGICIAGRGNVLCNNYVTGYRDGIGFKDGVSDIDIHHNDFEQICDDAIEADFAHGNIRVYDNRMNNCWTGLSSQPSLGGPSYFIRNVMYNIIRQAFKLKSSSVGNLLYHNTVVKSGTGFQVALDNREYVFAHTLSRNNLIIGGTGGATYHTYPTGNGQVMELATAAADYDFDYNGYGSIGTGRFDGVLAKAVFNSLEELREKTTEKHSIQVDLSVFSHAVPFPDPPFPARPFPPSLELKAGGAAIDKGQALANVNDAFQGAAPDLGAYEYGTALPHYGPRP